MRRSTRFFLGFFLLAALIGVSNLPAAARCAPVGTVCEEFSQCPVVFVGRVVGSKFREKSPFEDEKNVMYDVGEVYLLVEEAFRGAEVSQRMTIHSSKLSESSHGIAFRRGERYLIYGYINQETGEIWTGRCSRTRFLGGDPDPDDRERERKELSILRELTAAPEGVTISGRVFDFAKRDRFDRKNRLGLPGTEVILEGAGGTYRGKTDAKGNFEIRGVKAGDYTARFKFPEGYAPSPTKRDDTFKVLDRGCFEIETGAYSASTVSGQVLDGDGKPLNGKFSDGAGQGTVTTQVELVSLGAGGKLNEAADEARNDTVAGHSDISETGRFEIRGVRPGNYLVKLVSGEAATIPVTPTFWPDPDEPSRPGVIRVEHGKSVGELVIRVPERLVPRSFKGILLGVDGKPLPKTIVMLYRVVDGKGKCLARTQTDAEGRFQFIGHEGISYVVFANWFSEWQEGGHQKSANCEVPVTVSPDMDEIILRLNSLEPPTKQPDPPDETPDR
jgi:hypothetical protein